MVKVSSTLCSLHIWQKINNANISKLPLFSSIGVPQLMSLSSIVDEEKRWWSPIRVITRRREAMMSETGWHISPWSSGHSCSHGAIILSALNRTQGKARLRVRDAASRADNLSDLRHHKHSLGRSDHTALSVGERREWDRPATSP